MGIDPIIVVVRHTRNHKPTQFTLPPATLARLDARVAAARASGRLSSRSGEIRRLIDGGAQSARRILASADVLRQLCTSTEQLALVQDIIDEAWVLRGIEAAPR